MEAQIGKVELHGEVVALSVVKGDELVVLVNRDKDRETRLWRRTWRSKRKVSMAGGFMVTPQVNVIMLPASPL